MSNPALTSALCLPSLDIEALLQGRTIVALSNSFRNLSHFLLCPVDLSISTPQLVARYHSDFLESLKAPHGLADPDWVTVHAWARSKTCRLYGAEDDLAALSELTPWSEAYLRSQIQDQHKIFLLFLQVHRFTQPVSLMMPPLSEETIGNYIDVPGTWSDQRALPLLSNETFAQRQRQLIKLSPPRHPELEPLQTELVAVRENSLGAMALDRDLRYLLGWTRSEETRLDDSDLAWIQKIAQVGDADDTYEFKKLVLSSLLKLGFSDDEKLFMALDLADDDITSQGMSTDIGKLDVYCDAPYSVVGDCEAGQYDYVSHHVTAQLIHLGNTLLSREKFSRSVKILFVAGPLTDHAEQVAKGNKMNVMRPKTLQRLTELKARYPGAVDLLKLKTCLQAAPHGNAADDKINQFINETLQQLRLRSALVQSVKGYLESTGQEEIGLETVCGAYSMCSHIDLPTLSVGEVHDLLMELSSPVAGYLGRKKSSNGRDVFYFLRDLFVEDNTLTVSTY